MKEFIKAQATSIIATLVDYVVTFLLSKLFLVWFVAASIIGTTSGGIVNFILGRYWAFASKDEDIEGQGFKFFIVWIGNLALNAGGVHELNALLGDQYKWISKIV